jgi:hypothetical protein
LNKHRTSAVGSPSSTRLISQPFTLTVISERFSGCLCQLSGGVFGVDGLLSRAEFRNLIAFLEREREQRTNEGSLLGREDGEHPAEVFNAARSVKSTL